VRIFLLAVLVAATLTGCQTGGIPSNAQWVNVKNTNADRKHDNDACDRDATQAFPASVKTGGGADMQSSCTGAGYTTACTSSAATMQVDSNSERRASFSRRCMREKGWRPMVNGVDADPDK
jgi:hypothetical protein